jgi:hypothetical protein
VHALLQQQTEARPPARVERDDLAVEDHPAAREPDEEGTQPYRRCWIFRLSDWFEAWAWQRGGSSGTGVTAHPAWS